MSVILPAGRIARMVPADDAGEECMWVANYPLAHLRERSLLDPRQLDALDELARLYGLGGGSMPHRRHGAGGTRDEEAVAAARAQCRDLMDAAPLRARGPLLTLCQGEWPVERGVTLGLLAEGADAVADRLRLAR